MAAGRNRQSRRVGKTTVGTATSSASASSGEVTIIAITVRTSVTTAVRTSGTPWRSAESTRSRSVVARESSAPVPTDSTVASGSARARSTSWVRLAASSSSPSTPARHRAERRRTAVTSSDARNATASQSMRVVDRPPPATSSTSAPSSCGPIRPAPAAVRKHVAVATACPRWARSTPARPEPRLARGRVSQDGRSSGAPLQGAGEVDDVVGDVAPTAPPWVSTTVVPTAAQDRDPARDPRLGVGVDRGGGFFEDEDVGVGQQDAGQRQALPLPARDLAAEFPERLVEAVREPVEDLRARRPRRARSRRRDRRARRARRAAAPRTRGPRGGRGPPGVAGRRDRPGPPDPGDERRARAPGNRASRAARAEAAAGVDDCERAGGCAAIRWPGRAGPAARAGSGPGRWAAPAVGGARAAPTTRRAPARAAAGEPRRLRRGGDRDDEERRGPVHGHQLAGADRAGDGEPCPEPGDDDEDRTGQHDLGRGEPCGAACDQDPGARGPGRSPHRPAPRTVPRRADPAQDPQPGTMSAASAFTAVSSPRWSSSRRCSGPSNGPIPATASGTPTSATAPSSGDARHEADPDHPERHHRARRAGPPSRTGSRLLPRSDVAIAVTSPLPACGAREAPRRRTWS